MDNGLSSRALAFENLDAVIRDVDSLRANGYCPAGTWTLAQACGHLSEWLSFPVCGYPPQTLTARLMLWLYRNTRAPRDLRRVLATGTLEPEGPTLAETIPDAATADEAMSASRLREAVVRFQDYRGPFHPSPAFGPLDDDTLVRLQLIHCAHHLSRFVPLTRV